jgi:small conductance mechanosensitive channel
METTASHVSAFLTTYGLNVLGAILILIAGRIVAGIARGLMEKILLRANAEPTIISFVKSLTYIAILTFAVLAALSKFGIQTASFIAILGAAGFAVGFALQGSLSNFAAGVLILVLRPFKVGDYIDAAGVAGTVKEIGLFSSTLATPDNIKILVPNGKIYGDTIKNVSAFDTRRVDLVIGIGYSSSIQKAHEVLLDLINRDSRILADPPPQVAVSELADSSVNLVVRPWVKREDYWAVRFDLTHNIKQAFDENGIEIPFPQRVVHMVSDTS